jgi:lipopolysaccharide/colanic/teichoic acid biosynthesis glycosyltransferase
VKRLMDIAISGVALVLSAPLMGLLWLLVRLESPGDPIYTQVRVGRDGAPFPIYKLRTMVTGAEFIGAGLAVQEGDERITRMGRLLRKTSLDELPNLINVLRGDMSIVGPRPTVQVQVDHYTDRQRGRLRVKPGITGWAQIHGRASLPWSQRIELDLYYVEHQSLKLDLQILARTPAMLLGRKGIYKGDQGGWDITTEVPRPEQDEAQRPGSDAKTTPADPVTTEARGSDPTSRRGRNPK